MLMGINKPRVTTAIAPEVLAAIADLAEHEERSISQMAAILLREALQHRGWHPQSKNRSAPPIPSLAEPERNTRNHRHT
jgi:hypothetical protein